MTRALTDYEIFEKSSARNRRLLRQGELIMEVTEALSEALAREHITKAELAKRMDKSKAFVSQILAGGRNLTLKTIADVADALGCRIRVQALRRDRAEETISRFPPIRYPRETLAWGLARGIRVVVTPPAVKMRLQPVGEMIQGAA